MAKILIKSNKENNLVNALIYYMNIEKIEFEIVKNLDIIKKDITNIIYINENNDFENENLDINIPIILISNEKYIINKEKLLINYIITNLVNDNNIYSNVQKEYLYRKGIYSIFNKKVDELINNHNNYNRLIYDLTEIKLKPEDWTFKFESINETYFWLSKMNRTNSSNKYISFYSTKVYDDSVKEINYLTEKLIDVKNNKNIIDIFILTPAELKLMKSNYFFKILLNNISSNYKMYFIDKNKLIEKEPNIINKLRDGIIIYEDCVYKDTYDDEYSLGIVNCNKEIVEQYNNYFDYILDTYAQKLNSEGDINEF